jgi:hypothetical protein
MYNFLDQLDFIKNEIGDQEWLVVKNVADSLTLVEIRKCLNYLNIQLDKLDDLKQIYPDHSVVEYNRSIVLLMAYELEMTAMCA